MTRPGWLTRGRIAIVALTLCILGVIAAVRFWPQPQPKPVAQTKQAPPLVAQTKPIQPPSVQSPAVQPPAPKLPPIVAETAPSKQPNLARRQWREGQQMGRIIIPRLNVSAPIVQGANDKDLAKGAGHVPSTAAPGEPGNVALAAHRDTSFRSLRFIRAHDEIQLQTPNGLIRYHVRSTEIVTPKDVRVLRPTPDSELTLITCYPFFYRGHAPKRFIVHAEHEPDSALSAAQTQANSKPDPVKHSS